MSRWGDDGRWRVHSARMLAIWLHGRRRAPCVYQGEELGMTNMPLARIEDCRDIESINHHWAALRQGQPPEADGRHPRQGPRQRPVADALAGRHTGQPHAGKHAGFSTGTPWLARYPNFEQINAEQARAGADSVFHHHCQRFQLRRLRPVWLQDRTLPLLAEQLQIAAYLRVWHGAQLRVGGKFSDQAQHFDAPVADAPAHGWQLRLGNWPVDPADLKDLAIAPAPAPGPDLPAFALRPYGARICLGAEAWP